MREKSGVHDQPECLFTIGRIRKEHSGENNWRIVGYLDRDDCNRVCEVVIYNFGLTIAETFNKLEVDDFAKKNVNEYVNKHHAKKLFGENWTPDDLTTLVALQGRISSKNHPDDDTRGHGTVDLIEFFQEIMDGHDGAECKEQAKMCILSGHTHIRFDRKYRMGKDRDGRDTIAFNDENDLSRPPDSKYVRHLKRCHFPGTLIAIRFVLPERATEEVSDGR